MIKQIEVISMIYQQAERDVITVKATAKVNEKDDALFIRYTEPETAIQVLMKWDRKSTLLLSRRQNGISRMLFDLNQDTYFVYPQVGMVFNFIIQTKYIKEIRHGKKMQGLIWEYRLKNEEETIGEYKVQLHFRD